MKIFDSVVFKKPKRNKFDLSHEVKLTLNMGDLVPILVQETVPGDKFRVNTTVLLRALALIAPVMHRVDLTVHFFFVPNRLVWKNWGEYITGGRDGLQAPVLPSFNLNAVNTISPTYIKTGSLLDYMGFPVMKSTDTYSSFWNTQYYNGLPLRAYQLIWDTYYRDQNIDASIVTVGFDGDGAITGTDLTNAVTLRKRAWEKDYFTSCLPWTQRGNPVSVPFTATVNYRKPANVLTSGDVSLGTLQSTATTGVLSSTAPGGATQGAYIDNIASITSSAITVNALRVSVKLQEWLEANARGGGRYIEQIKAHFGVVSSDSRLQRPEYLGGGKAPVVISEVLQTAAGTNPVGQLAGHGLGVGNTNTFSRFFEEHGHVIGLMSILPKTAYQTALPPYFWRNANTQYLFPEFAQLGEQTVYNAEIYTNPADGSATPSNAFGYQSRYAEYKYCIDRISGYFRESFSYWHLGRQFTTGNQPALNSAFIYANPRTDIFAVSGDPHHFVAQVYHKIDALRPLPYFNVPNF